ARLLPLIDVHDLPQQLDGFLSRSLERIAAHYRPECAAFAETADLGEDVLGALRLAAREDDDALAVEAALHYVPRPVRQRLPGNVVLLEHLLGLGLIDEVARRLHLHHVRPELARDLGGVTRDVHRRLALLVGDAFPAGIRPGHYRKAVPLRLLSQRAQILVLMIAGRRPGIDGVADGDAAKPDRVFHGARDGALGRMALAQSVAVVELENERNLACVLSRHRLDESERRRIGVATRVDGELHVVFGVVSGRI